MKNLFYIDIVADAYGTKETFWFETDLSYDEFKIYADLFGNEMTKVHYDYDTAVENICGDGKVKLVKPQGYSYWW